MAVCWGEMLRAGPPQDGAACVGDFVVGLVVGWCVGRGASTIAYTRPPWSGSCPAHFSTAAPGCPTHAAPCILLAAAHPTGPLLTPRHPSSSPLQDLKKVAALSPELYEPTETTTLYVCQCGRSADGVFCDGSHAPTSIGPVPVQGGHTLISRLCDARSPPNPVFRVPGC